MNEQELFLAKLASIESLSEKKNGILSEEEIRQHFDGISLNDAQWELIFNYLQSKKIRIAGRAESSQYILTPEDLQSEDKIWDEDEVFSMYLNDLNAVKPAAAGEEDALIEKILKGDPSAVNRLSELYLFTVMAIAKEYAKGAISVGDLIQEGNLGLLTGISLLADKPEDISVSDYLTDSIRESISLYVVEQGDQKNIGNKVADKVNSLHSSLVKLEEDLGHEVSKAELSAFLNIPLEEIEEMIRLSGDDLGLS